MGDDADRSASIVAADVGWLFEDSGSDPEKGRKMSQATAATRPARPRHDSGQGRSATRMTQGRTPYPTRDTRFAALSTPFRIHGMIESRVRLIGRHYIEDDAPSHIL